MSDAARCCRVGHRESQRETRRIASLCERPCREEGIRAAHEPLPLKKATPFGPTAGTLRQSSGRCLPSAEDFLSDRHPEPKTLLAHQKLEGFRHGSLPLGAHPSDRPLFHMQDFLNRHIGIIRGEKA